jgi:hypothetical protein
MLQKIGRFFACETVGTHGALNIFCGGLCGNETPAFLSANSTRQRLAFFILNSFLTGGVHYTMVLS